MRIEQIRSFVSVYETNSFTKASQKLFTEQPVISKHILHLESELGCELFVRSTRKVEPTHAADILYPKVRDAIELIDTGIADVKMLESRIKSQVTIGYVTLYMDTLTTSWVRSFEQNFDVAISELSYSNLFDQITDGTIDCGFLGVVDEKVIPAYLGRLLVDSLDEVIVIGKRHPLAHKKSLCLDDLLNENFVYPQCAPTAETSIVLKDFMQADKIPHIETTRFESSALHIIELGQGVADIPSQSNYDSANVISIPYESDSKIHYYFIWNKGNNSPVFKSFSEYIESCVAEFKQAAD